MWVARGAATALSTAFLTSSRSAAPPSLYAAAAASTSAASAAFSSFPPSTLVSLHQASPPRRGRGFGNNFKVPRRPLTARRSTAGTGDGGGPPSVCDGPPLPMRMHHLPSVESTQDEARRILGEVIAGRENECPLCFAVSASEQLHGRGTKGRDWIGRPGNVFVTVCLPSDLISAICPITLLPLKVGTIVAQQTHRILSQNGAYRNVRVKWPNDVLVDDKKVGGVLIESHYDPERKESWFLVGIGVNVAHAPKIFQFGPQRGRQATCLAEHCIGWLTEGCGEGDEAGDERGVEEARALATDIARGIHAWACAEQSPAFGGGEGVDQKAASEAIVREWSQWAEFGKELVLRDKPGNEAVIPLGVELDGQLRVKTRDGRITLLCADYLL